MENKSFTVFICEDDEAIIEIVKMVLVQKGYQVAYSTDGKKAVQKIKKIKPDVLLVDLWLPVYNGAEIIKKVRALAEFKNTPIILFSASREVERISTELGVDDFLPKPFDIYELEEKINRLAHHVPKPN